MLRRDALPLVLDRDPDGVDLLRPVARAFQRSAADGDPDRRAFRAVLDRVVDQVLEQLGQLVAVADDGRLGDRALDGYFDAARLRGELHGIDDGGDHRSQRNRRRRWKMLVELDLGERQEAVDQPVHPLGLCAHHLQEAVGRRLVLPGGAAQRLDAAEQHRYRGSELMARIGDEIRARAPVAPDRGHIGHRDQGDGSVGRRFRKRSDAGGEFEIGSGDVEVDLLRSAGGDHPFGGFQNPGIAQRRDQVGAHRIGPQDRRRPARGAHDPPRTVDRDHRAGQVVEHDLGRGAAGREIAEPLVQRGRRIGERGGEPARNQRGFEMEPLRRAAGIEAVQPVGHPREAREMPPDRRPERGGGDDGGNRRRAQRHLSRQHQHQQHADEGPGENRERPVQRAPWYRMAVHIVAGPALHLTAATMLPAPAAIAKRRVWLAARAP